MGGRATRKIAKAKKAQEQKARRSPRVAITPVRPAVNPTTQLERDAQDNTPASSRKLKRENSDVTVKQIWHDNFVHFTREMMYCKIDPATKLCCFDRLKADKALWMAGLLDMGKHYYKSMREIYEGDMSAMKRFPIDNVNEPDDDDLIEAVDDIRNHTAQFARIEVRGWHLNNIGNTQQRRFMDFSKSP